MIQGQKVKERRLAMGLSLQALEDLTRIKKSMLWAMERCNKKQLDNSRLVALAGALNVETKDLMLDGEPGQLQALQALLAAKPIVLSTRTRLSDQLRLAAKGDMSEISQQGETIRLMKCAANRIEQLENLLKC